MAAAVQPVSQLAKDCACEAEVVNSGLDANKEPNFEI
jgi:hypothetical protein